MSGDNEMRKKRISILMLSGGNPSDLDHVYGIARAARKKQVDVEVFLMGDAVHCLMSPRLEALAREGARVRFCVVNAMERGLDRSPGYPWSAEEASQYDLACMMEESDVFLAFT